MNFRREYTEDELIALLMDGNEAAFEQLFRLHHHRIAAFVYKITGAGPVAEELVQDIFFKLWTNREKLGTVQNFKAYLHTIARNHIYSFLRKQGNDLRKKSQWEMEYTHEPLPAENLHDFKMLLEEAIDQLPEQQQKAYLLSRDEGLPNIGIAKEMGISLETVKKHIVLALRNIRKQVLQNKDRVVYIFYIFSHFYYLF